MLLFYLRLSVFSISQQQGSIPPNVWQQIAIAQAGFENNYSYALRSFFHRNS